MELEFEYAMKILAQIDEMFNDDECANFINKKDLLDEKKATAFLHALANVAPAMFYKTLTNDEQDYLGFNHIANRLCFQFGTVEPDKG